MNKTRQKISKLAMIGAALGLICTLASIAALFWFDAENAKQKKIINELDTKRAAESKKAKARVWSDLKNKLPQKPTPNP